jgi:hypothetical protein
MRLSFYVIFVMHRYLQYTCNKKYIFGKNNMPKFSGLVLISISRKVTSNLAVASVSWFVVSSVFLLIVKSFISVCFGRFSSREVAAVKDWLSCRLPFHAMRDNPAHVAPLLAGMWGARYIHTVWRSRNRINLTEFRLRRIRFRQLGFNINIQQLMTTKYSFEILILCV